MLGLAVEPLNGELVMKYLISIVTLMLVALHSSATVIWDEQANGDLSNELSLPTLLVVGLGNNIVKGQVGPENSDWRDIFVFDVANDLRLTNIFIEFYDQTDVDHTSFLLSPSADLCNCNEHNYKYDVYSNIRTSDVGSDYGNFFIPLYGHDLKQYFSLWESLSDPAHYSLNFVFGERSLQVPEPSVLLLMFIAMIGLASKSRYRR